VAFPTYSSPVAQTIRTVQHLDGVEVDYVFSGGIGFRNYGANNYGDGTYGGTTAGGSAVTPASQDEKWILDELAVEFGLSVVS
jgi:hypothetical protein